jgi:REP element-mobilizing transposase RayT
MAVGRRKSHGTRRHRGPPRQQQLPLGNTWGGRRRGAGRKPKGTRAGVPHRARSPRTGREPVHCTMRLLPCLPSLRRPAVFAVVRRCLTKARDRNGTRICHFSVQSNHLHLVVEAPDRERLARGMQGLAVRIAKRLNKHLGRKGQVFADRYHDRVLRGPRQVRNALCYVLNNAQHHGLRHFRGREPVPDPCASGAWFDGFLPPLRAPPPPGPAPVVGPATWLLRFGWWRCGRIGIHETPGPRRHR